MTEKVLADILRENLIGDGDVVLAGVSGGADSVCLLLLLQKLREEIAFTLRAVHVEHGIRGAESRSDAAFVEELCEKSGVLCRTFYEDVPRFARERGIGLEEAARIRRCADYAEAADAAAREFAGRRVSVALAHHAEDNAETVLFQMARGSGLDGLGGMEFVRVRDGLRVIRPLLNRTREEIEAYLAERGQEYRVDKTNADIGYSRNRIRLRVLPELSQINAQAVAHINRSAAFVREANDYLNGVIEKIYQEDVAQREDGVLILEHLWSGCEPFLQRGAIRRAIAAASGAKKDLTAAHVLSVQSLISLQVGRKIALPGGVRAERVYDGVLLCRGGETARPKGYAAEISSEQLTALEDGGQLEIALPDGAARLRIFPFSGEMEKIPKKTYTKWLNYDKMSVSEPTCPQDWRAANADDESKIHRKMSVSEPTCPQDWRAANADDESKIHRIAEDGLQLRTRAAGDYLVIDGAGHTKKLKEYFVNGKVSGKERDTTLLLADGSHILWVSGARIGADCKVLKNTKRVLEVQLLGGKYHESEEH